MREFLVLVGLGRGVVCEPLEIVRVCAHMNICGFGEHMEYFADL